MALRSSVTVGGVTAEPEDVLVFDGSAFSLLFDGSDVGVGAFSVDGFSQLPDGSLLLSFTVAGSVPGITVTVDDSDLVRFVPTSLGNNTAGVFSLYFDGSDVGLTLNSEDVDAMELLPDGRLLLSTTDIYSVPGVSGDDEDALAFTPTALGDVTSGTWSLYFDGSDVGLDGGTSEDVDALAIDSVGRIYLSTLGNFSVPGLAGADEDVFVFTPSLTGSATAGTYDSVLFFDGSLFGLAANDVYAIDLP